MIIKGNQEAAPDRLPSLNNKMILMHINTTITINCTHNMVLLYLQSLKIIQFMGMKIFRIRSTQETILQ
jgi:hypothetical protein